MGYYRGEFFGGDLVISSVLRCGVGGCLRCGGGREFFKIAISREKEGEMLRDLGEEKTFCVSCTDKLIIFVSFPCFLFFFLLFISRRLLLAGTNSTPGPSHTSPGSSLPPTDAPNSRNSFSFLFTFHRTPPPSEYRDLAP